MTMTELEEAMLIRAGIPLPDQAFKETQKFARPYWQGRSKRWSCDVVYHAAYESAFLRQKDLSQEQLATLYEESFVEACRIFVRGGTLHKRPKYQCKPSETGRKHMDQIKAIVAKKNPPPAQPAIPHRIHWTQTAKSKSELTSDEWVSDIGYSLTVHHHPKKRYEITRPGETHPFATTVVRDDVNPLVMADMQAKEVHS
jgi:hypothetical protein